MESLENNALEQKKNQEAESSWVRKNVWGSEEVAGSEEDMRTTVLGDINHPPPVVIAPQQNSNSAMMAIALASTLGLGGLAGYFFANREQPQAPVVEQPNFDDESVSIGLGQIEDYLGQ